MTELMGTALVPAPFAQIIPMNNFELQAQARIILDAIAFTPFEQCQPLSRNFRNLPARPGIYARSIEFCRLQAGAWRIKSCYSNFSILQMILWNPKSAQ